MPGGRATGASVLVLACLAPVVAPARPANCFVGLDAPLKEPPLSEDAIVKMRSYFLANLNIDGTGAMIASPGAVPALGGCCEGGYRYDWARDGGLSMGALQRVRGSGAGGAQSAEASFSDVKVKSIMDGYVRWVARLQAKDGQWFERFEGDKLVVDRVDAHLEAKWDIGTALPYRWNWCRRQSDGPGLRAQALIQYALGDLIDEAERGSVWELVQFDLRWLVQAPLEDPTCDLWEETFDRGFFWNLVTMRSALLAGAVLAEKMGDLTAAETYRRAAEERIGDPLADHVDSYITECPSQRAGSQCRDKDKRIDSAVILSLTHAGHTRELGSGNPLDPPSAEAVAHTVQAYNLMFCDLYAVNQKDTADGVPGILYGRYARDSYGGGNPWQLLTAALASLMYQIGEFVADDHPLSAQELGAWKAALFESFSGSATDFVAAGDAILTRLAHHVDPADDWHLYEQIDRETGQQYNAKDLTWSYAEVLSALRARERTLRATAVFAQELPASGIESSIIVPMVCLLGVLASVCFFSSVCARKSRQRLNSASLPLHEGQTQLSAQQAQAS